MAIKWVKKHIHHFGGDPKKITLFGGSAGGISVHAQIISPYNKDLLAGGISQSGTMLYRNIVSLNSKELERNARKVSELVECDGKDLNQDVLECLQAVPAEDLISKTNSGLKWPKDLTKEPIQEFRENFFQWDPIVDYYSEKPFLPMSPLEAIKSKSYNQIPFMSGTNKDEGAFFLSLIFENLDELPAAWDSLGAGWLGLTRTSSEVQLSSENILLANIMRKYYTGNDFNIEDENLSNLSNLLGDGVFLSPDQKSVSLMARGDAPVYNYMLSYRGTKTFATRFGLDAEKDFGVMHGDELLYLFKNDLFPRVFENEDEEKLSNYMVTLWTNFAKFGEPTPFHSDETVYWKPVGNRENNYMDLKPEPELKQNVAAERMRFWERLIWATREKNIDRKILFKKVQKFFWSNRVSTH
jgi:carboxylesterase type B